MNNDSQEIDHIHLWDLPDHVFPRNTKEFNWKNEANHYLKELISTVSRAQYANTKLQHSAALSIFNIKSVIQKSGYYPNVEDTFRFVEEFGYHYENFCHRVFSSREKLLHFLNIMFRIGLKGNDINVKMILVALKAKDSQMADLVESFRDNQLLGKTISDRNSFTHTSYYGKNFDHFFRPMHAVPSNEDEMKKWFKTWQKEIGEHANRSDKAFHKLTNLMNDVAGAIVASKTITH